MNSNFYTPLHQRKLAEEVLYLHSLWRSSTTPITNPNPNPNLGVTHSTDFKKPRKHKPKEIEWPVLPEPPEPASDFTSWPDLVSKPKPVPVPEEAKSKPDVIQLQKLAVKLCKDNFAKDDEDSSEDEEEEEVEVNAFEFFKGLFEKDENLRECYQKYWENGEFYCLVCVGIGVKVSKRYKDCVALLQHAVTVLKTKKKGAHRGFGRAICGLLGWNFERLPSIVLDVGECSKKGVEEDAKEDDSNATFVDATKPKEHENNNQDVMSKNEGCISADKKLQQNSLNICCEYFEKSKDDECDEEELATRESIAFKFFSSIFASDGDLRNYYEKNRAKGKFYCLVCSAIWKEKLRSPFDNCYRLVQHTRGVPKKKIRWAHLAYGKVVCQVLGWEYPTAIGLGLLRKKSKE